MGHQELGSGFFSFFLSNHLTAHASRGVFPVSQAFLDCREVCRAITDLYVSTLREQREKKRPVSTATMSPELVFHDIPWHSFTLQREGSVGTDAVDGPSDQPPATFDEDASFSLEFLDRFMSDETRKLGKDLYTICDDNVPVWLVTRVMPALKVLYRHGYLKPGFDESDDVFRTALCMISKSVAAVLDRTAARSSSADLFLVCFIYISSAVTSAFDEESVEAQKRGEQHEKVG